jgi:RHS repeat-associated protein
LLTLCKTTPLFFFLQLKKIFSTEKENITFAVVMNEPKPILAFENTQSFDYYNYVIDNLVFEEAQSVVYDSYYYEKEIDSAHTIRHYHYIYGNYGVVALHIATPTTDSMYYIHTDHLGSYCAITDANKEVRQRITFDPWGNPRIDDWQTGFALTFRGFTGHEHYPFFKIINMNGRLYDPVIGRYFSPDNFVQTPEFTQGFNRYSYCLNNPLKYIDPSGQTWYDVNGNRRFIDDGIDNMIIEISKRQFNRLERKFNNVRNYEKYRDKLAEINGYTTKTTFGNFKEMSKNGSGVEMLPGIDVHWHRPEGQSYSEWSKTNTVLNNVKSGVNLETYILIGAAKTAMTEVANDAQALKGLGNFAKWTGYLGAGANVLISSYQAVYAPTWYEATGHVFDGGMSIVGSLGIYGLGLNLYYNNVIKNYPEIQKSVNQQLIDRSDMMQKGFIPIGHPGFPFR